MKIHILTLAIFLALTGCTYTYTVTSHKQFNYEIKDASASVNLTDGTDYDAQAVVSQNDTLRFTDTDDNSRQRIPIQAISSVETNNHWTGALKGLIFGSIVGVIIGEALPVRYSGDSSDSDNLIAFWKIVAPTALVGFGGTIYGAIHGDKVVYEFTPQIQDTLSVNRVAP